MAENSKKKLDGFVADKFLMETRKSENTPLGNKYCFFL